MTKVFPKEITSYDLLKTFAVVFMIIDHIGIYFFPDQEWFRVLGRFSAPVWLFLIGYARTRDIPVKLWGGALLLTFANVFVVKFFFPLTILFGMMLARKYQDRVAQYMFSGLEPFLLSLVGLGVLMIPSHIVIQYGLLCLMIPIYGYMCRHKEELARVPAYQRFGFVGLTFATYVFMNVAYNDLSIMQLATVAGGVGLVFAYLYGFTAQTYSKLTAVLPKALTLLVQFGGRRTLEIYVGHLILFKIIACAMGLEGFGLFEWDWF